VCIEVDVVESLGSVDPVELIDVVVVGSEHIEVVVLDAELDVDDTDVLVDTLEVEQACEVVEPVELVGSVELVRPVDVVVVDGSAHNDVVVVDVDEVGMVELVDGPELVVVEPSDDEVEVVELDDGLVTNPMS